MSVEQGEIKNEALKEILADMLKGMPSPITGGVFNRHMFVESLAIKAGMGIGLEEEDIIKYSNMTEREFRTIKDEYIASGIIKVEKNMFGITLYSLQLT